MATTKTPVTFQGELRWVVVPPFSQPQTPLKPKPGQENNTHYSLEIECSQAQYNDLLKQGVSRLTVLRNDESTKKTFIRLRAPKINGKWTGPEPVVKNVDGSDVSVMIANGSEGIVSANIEIFQSKDGEKITALRFHTVMVTKLIPYVRQDNIAENNEQVTSHNQDLSPPFETAVASSEDW